MAMCNVHKPNSNMSLVIYHTCEIMNSKIKLYTEMLHMDTSASSAGGASFDYYASRHTRLITLFM